MAECHVVHLGRDSRIRAATARIRRSPDGSLVVDFLWRDQAVPVTEIMMTDAQARALADELTNGLLTHLVNELDDTLGALDKAKLHHGYGITTPQTLASTAGGGHVGTTGSQGGSTPPPSTTA